MEKIEELLDDLTEKQETKNSRKWFVIILAIVGAITAIGGIAFLVYRLFSPDSEELEKELEEDFEEEMDDYFSEDEDEEAE